MQTKKSLLKAMLFSLLICLAGGVVWGLIYSVGFMVYIVALGTAFLAGAIYNKYYKFNIVSFIWIVIFLAIFNEIATLVALNFQIVNEIMPELSFARGWEMLFELISTNSEVKSAVISDSVFNIVCVVVGAGFVWIDIARKNKKENAISSTPVAPALANPVTNPAPSVNAIPSQNNAFATYYATMKDAFREVVIEYKQTKDKDAFKAKVSELKVKYIDNLQRQENKDKVKAEVEKDLSQESIPNVDKVTLNTMLKLL